jgi:transcriptional regulator with XRE-family HTH domain
MNILILLGKNIIILRKKKHTTQEQLAASCHISVKYLSQIESGQANPTIKILRKISTSLGLQLYRLFK